jgi:hypothetical protein
MSNGPPHYQIDLWVTPEHLRGMVGWCDKKIARGGWSYHTHRRRLLGEGGVEVRFYFLNEADLRAFAGRFAPRAGDAGQA